MTIEEAQTTAKQMFGRNGRVMASYRPSAKWFREEAKTELLSGKGTRQDRAHLNRIINNVPYMVGTEKNEVFMVYGRGDTWEEAFLTARLVKPKKLTEIKE